jgi:hypothetical protein
MSIQGEVYNRAATHSGLSGLVSDRIYYLKVPASVTYPCVSYQLFGDTHPARASGTDHALKSVTLQVDGWSENRDDHRQLRAEIEAAFNRWAADGSAYGTVVQQAFHQQSNDLYEDDTQIYHVTADFQVWYEG